MSLFFHIFEATEPGMKKGIFFFTSILFAGNYTFSQIVPLGESGTVIMRGEMKDGKETGVWKEEYENAPLQQRCKMNFGAAIAASEPSKKEVNISLLVQGTVSEIQAFTERTGGVFVYAIGDIASVTLKGKDIKALADQPYVIRVEADNPYSKTQVMNDSMLVNNRLVQVHAGAAPLAQAYKGDGVVIGIIDTGIDYNHPDFKDASGKTRIKFLWDQVLPDSAPPLPYNYGQEWTATDIDNGKAGAHRSTFESQYGHGTHVASVAAGNGLAINKYAGAASQLYWLSRRSEKDRRGI